LVINIQSIHDALSEKHQAFDCIAKHLLNNSNCDICKKCPISEVPSPLDIYTGFKEHSSTVQSLTNLT